MLNQDNVTSWQDLPYSLKEANRAFALSWREKLAMVNARFSSHSNSIELSDNELNMMSSMEHARWCAERKIDGWQFSSTRSNIAKRHTLIKPWHDLTQQQQQGNSHDVLRPLDVQRRSRAQVGKAFLRIACATNNINI